MSSSLLFDFVTGACRLVLLLSLVPLAVSAGCGLIVSVLQAVTQIQEQTCIYLAKFAAASAVFALGGEWYLRELIGCLRGALGMLSQLGKL